MKKKKGAIGNQGTNQVCKKTWAQNPGRTQEKRLWGVLKKKWERCPIDSQGKDDKKKKKGRS